MIFVLESRVDHERCTRVTDISDVCRSSLIAGFLLAILQDSTRIGIVKSSYCTVGPRLLATKKGHRRPTVVDLLFLYNSRNWRLRQQNILPKVFVISKTAPTSN
jgi:hypothetical protein